mgnify:FL=1|tara:strand:+ start:205 stop:738 length:534 start_codon:yes stop_codon:yes gene_type:complete
MKKYAIALGFKGKLYSNIVKAWQIFENSMNIKYMSTSHALPHITIISGKTKNIEKIYKKLEKIKIKKFKLKSPGLGIFANKDPNLYIRWEQSLNLLKISNAINKKTSKFFQKIYQTSNDSLWVPKTTLAWKDLNYSDLKMIFNKTKFIFKKYDTIINCIYLIDFTHNEIITHKIKLN